MTFSTEQLNFFKFSTVVLDDFPVALRQVFVSMWNNQVATSPGVPKWDDSLAVRTWLVRKEGSTMRVSPLAKSYKEWDCTVLFKATLFAHTFAVPDGTGGVSTLHSLYVRPCGIPAGTFHHSVVSLAGDKAETYALALDQLRLLRNTLCHQISTQKIDKATFDNYMQLAKDAFTALGQNTTKIDEIASLGEDDFPTTRLQQLEDELKKEKDSAIKFKQMDDHLAKIKSLVVDVSADMKDVKTDVMDVKAQVEDVGSDMKSVKTELTGMKTQMQDIRSEAKEVKTELADVKTRVEDVRSDVKTKLADVKTRVEDLGSDVKTELADVKTRVEDVGSDVKTELADVKTRVEDVGSDVKTELADVKTRVEDVESDVKTELADVKTRVEDVGSDVKTELADVKTRVEDVGSDVKTELADVKTQMQDIGSEVKTKLTDVKTQLKEVGSDVKELNARVDDITEAMQAGSSEGLLFPDSCMPDEIPYFVGRQEECGAVLNHLTNGDTRLVGIWGPPGFGKTSLAINVAHHLRGLKIPVYFTSLRGMKSKDELVSKLLSIFTDAKQASNVSPSHWLIQCLQQLEKTFVLILDNADDLLESGDSMLKDDFLRFTQEILAQCSHIKLLFTTRESLDYLRHKLHVHQERVGVLDEVSSVSLVQQSLVKPVSDNDCSHIVNVCGRVPLAMRLMCGIMKEENVSLSELLDELKVSPLVEVLDDESFPDDSRLKIIINRSFERLPGRERDAFVSLAVFPSSFEMQEAKAVLDLKTPRLTKKVIDSLKRKSLIDCSDDFKSCTIHSLLRSFIDERRTANHAVQTIFSEAQLRFYDYHISSFGVANENFLTGHSNDAFLVFVRQRESILISLENGAKEDALYPKVVKVLSKAELFFYALLPSEELLVEKLYRTTVGEAKKRQRRDDECNLLAAKSFRCLGGFYVDRQALDQSLQAGILDTDRYTAKRLCYLGVHQLLDGRTDDGISSLRASVDRLSSDCDEKVLKILACHVLAICYRKKGDTKNASDFQTFCSNECKSASFSPAVLNLFSRDISSADKVTDCDSIIEQDVFFFVVVAELLPILYRELEFDKETETERSKMINYLVGLHKDLLSLFHKGIVRVCCNALFSLRCFKEAAEGFQVMITNELEKTRESELRCTAQNYLVHGLALKEMKDYKGASLCLKKSLDIRMQVLQESRDVNQGVKMVADVIDSIIECLQMQKHLDGATTGHTYDFKVICEELTSVLKKSMEKIHNVDHDAIAKNCCKLGRCYIRMDDYNAALESFEQAIKIREEHVGDSNEKVSCLSNKGTAYFIMNRKSEAYEAYQSALDLRKRLGIEDHADTAPIYEAIGVNHFESKEFSESLDAFRQCLKLRKKHLGNHTLTAHSFTVTGYVYLMREEYNAARENFQHAANLAKSLLGDHEVTASQFELLATAYLKMGNYRGALDAYQESRNIRVKLLSEHRDTAMSFQLADNNCFEIGNFERHVYKTHDNKIFAEIIDSIWNCLKTPNNLDSASTGDSDDFKPLLEELKSVLQSMEQINDVEHAELARNYNQLGCCFFLMDDNNAALESFEQAIKIREEHLADSVNKVSCLVNKGHVYSKKNQAVEAGKAYQSALDLRKLLEIEDHADTATIYDLLGENYFVLEKFDEALEAFRQSLLLRKKHLGCHTLTAQTHAVKAAVHFEMEKYEAAGKHFQHAADMSKSLLGDQEETASMFQCLANTYVETENYRGALDALQEVKNIRLKLSGEHLDTAMSFEQVGNVCLMMDDFEEAIRSFRKASELKLNLLGDHLDTAQSYQLLGTAQLGNDDFSDAVESLKTALRIKLKAPGCHPETEETLKLLRYASQCATSVGSTQPSLSADQKHT